MTDFLCRSQSLQQPFCKPSEITAFFCSFQQIAVIFLGFSSRVSALSVLTLKHLSLFLHTQTRLTSLLRKIGTKKSMLLSSSVIVAIGLTLSGSQILMVPEDEAVAKQPFPTETRLVIQPESTSLITKLLYNLRQSTVLLSEPKLGSATSVLIRLNWPGRGVFERRSSVKSLPSFYFTVTLAWDMAAELGLSYSSSLSS